MNFLIRSAFVALMVLGLGRYAHAGTINFVTLTENNPGGHGEGAWSSLPLIVDGVNLTITGYENDVLKYAYLDWDRAGLGVCKGVVNAALVNTQDDGRRDNNCNPSSDDNITFNESLQFVFDRDVTIDKLWFNNSHDGGFDYPNDKVNIAGTDYLVKTGYVGDANFIGAFSVNAGTPFRVAFANEQFYVSGMKVTAVPDEATTLLLLSVGMCLLLAIKLRVG